MDYLYFLTNPSIANTNTASQFSFVFMGRFFFLDYNVDLEPKTVHGYKLSTQLIQGLYGSDFDIDMIRMHQSESGGETMIACVAEVPGRTNLVVSTVCFY